VPSVIIVVFSTPDRALWISGEKQTDSIKVTQGNPVISVRERNRKSPAIITVSGTGTLRYKGHQVVVLESDVLVDGSSLKKIKNWALLPNGRLKPLFQGELH
jgi:hypothetical protein